MSINALIEQLKQGDTSDGVFLDDLRTGLNTIIDGMQDTRYKRTDTLSELEERMGGGDHLDQTDLLDEIKALQEERTVLKNETEAFRLEGRAQNVCCYLRGRQSPH